MKNKKQEKSLTARERKILRQNPGMVIKEPQTAQTGVVEVSGKKVPLTRKSLFLIIGAIFMAIVMIVFAVLIPVVFVPMYDYRGINNPVAVIRLSNGDSIEFEIFEEQVPYAATNFLYLAQKGFFDDTVIFDTTNRYVRFGQYEDAAYTGYRTTNEKFLQKVKEIKIPSNGLGKPSTESPLDYRVTKDTEAAAAQYSEKANEFGYLSQSYLLSGTEFQICGSSPGESLNVANKNENATSTIPKNMSGYVLGRCVNERSFEVVRKIAEMEQNKDNNHPFWSAPKQTIKIQKIDLYKMDYWGKWRTFNWNDYFKDHVTWYSGSGIVKPNPVPAA